MSHEHRINREDPREAALTEGLIEQIDRDIDEFRARAATATGEYLTAVLADIELLEHGERNSRGEVRARMVGGNGCSGS